MKGKSEQKVGSFVIRNGRASAEFDVVVRPRISLEDDPSSTEGTLVPVNLTLDPDTHARLKDIRKHYQVQCYSTLEQVMRELKDDRAFTGFYNGEYKEPRRVGGQQRHFKLSPEMSERFSKLSWKCTAGNKSRLARAAVAYVWHFILNPPFIPRRGNA